MNERSETSPERDRIEESVREAKTALLKYEKEDKKYLYARVGKLIEYVTGRIDYYENARSRIFTASVTLLGFSVGVLTFGMDYIADAPWLLSVLVLIGASIISMAIHLWHGGRKYSFRDAVESPWYYINNIPKFKEHNGYNGVKNAFDEDVAHNFTQIAKRKLVDAIQKDVEQLVMLYAILAHKEDDAGLTTKVIEWGLGIFILSLIVGFVVKLAMPLP